jgi:D-amino peptidase
MKKKTNLFRTGIILFLLIMSATVNSVTAQKKQMKIYVNTDLEGISGVYKFAQTREKDTPLNIQACEYFMGDLAAVIHGLRDGGATEVIVLDGHGGQAVLPHLMDAGATYLTGQPKTGGPLCMLDSTFAGMCMIGFHAMNGTPDGVLHHTQSSKTEHKYWYNGVEWGEMAQNSAVAGYYNVPPIMASGDEATCREAHKFFGDNIVTVAVKKGLSREAAQLYPFELTRKALYEGAKKAMAQISKCKPFQPQLPLQAKKQWLDADKKVQTKEGTVTDLRHVLDF